MKNSNDLLNLMLILLYIKQFFNEFPIPEPVQTKELSEHRDINIQFVDVYYKPTWK